MGGPDLEEQEVPSKIRDSHYCLWWFLFTLFMATAIGCLVALKIFDALIALMIGIWAYYLTKDSCKQMSQQCLFSFGLMCCIQAVMEFIILAMSLPGRRTQSTSYNGGAAQQSGSPHAAPSPFMGGGHSSSYTVTVKTSPFFSEEEGWHYNLQSAMMIANCLVFIIGALIAKFSYGEYPRSLFDDVGESRPMAGGGAYSGGGGGRYYGGGGPPQNSLGGGQRLGGGGGQRAASGNTGMSILAI